MIPVYRISWPGACGKSKATSLVNNDHSTKQSNHLNIRRGIVWQDTTLSLCYDRPCMAFVDGSVHRIPRSTTTEGLPYLECCYGIVMVMNDIYHEWTHCRRVGSATLPAVRFQVASEHILLWEATAAEYLRDRRSCIDDTQRILHDVFQIFVNFFLFQLDRHHLAAPLMCLREDSSPDATLDAEQDQAADPRHSCLERCDRILELFLSLRKSHSRASRLWILMHICFGCSFYIANELKRANTRLDGSIAPESLQSRRQVLFDLAENLERKNPNTMHPHYTDSLKALRQMIASLY